MARDPQSLWSPLPESGRQGAGTKTQFIVHSTGDRGSAKAIFGYFSRADVVVESTFVVGLSPADPTRQMLDSSEVADANLKANTRAIAVEVVGTENDPFTDWQISELIRLGRWARTQHPIPARTCPAWDVGGFGWHVMFGAPGPWTPVAKSCPGPTRINQLRSVVFPAIFAATAPPAPTIEEEDDDMALLVKVSPDGAGAGGGYFLRDGAGYDWISDIATVGSLQRAGVKQIEITQGEHSALGGRSGGPREGQLSPCRWASSTPSAATCRCPSAAGQPSACPRRTSTSLIDRIPFWLAIRKDTPYQRETAQFQRDQVDQQPEAGEQSLAGWWTRSQMSFHYGAGLDYLDTTARPTPEDRLRFKTSRNVDVWTPGQVTRLNGTALSHRPAR
jgi:hypothetical protein